VRVVFCPTDECSPRWRLATACPHWTPTCARARKAKKPAHRMKNVSKPGFDVDMTGIGPEGWPYEGHREPTEAELALTPRRYTGHWAGPDWSVWVPAPRGNLLECANRCGLRGAS
jgi:hypothetical protein